MEIFTYLAFHYLRFTTCDVVLGYIINVFDHRITNESFRLNKPMMIPKLINLIAMYHLERKILYIFQAYLRM